MSKSSADKSSTTKSTKDKAREARLAAEAAHKRRERLIQFGGAGAVLIVVVLIIVFAVRASGGSSGTNGPDPSAALPKGVDTTSYAFAVTQNPGDKIPTVQVWEDFQCPACKNFEETISSALYAAAAKGEINLQLRPTAFLDKNLPQSKNTSARAISAWGCAIDAGKSVEYHTAVFVNQPPVEGTQVTDEQLIEYGKQAGISGAEFDSFKSCVEKSTYLGWSANSTSVFDQDAVPGTPAVFVNGKELSMKGIRSPEELMTKIKSMAGV